jgi:hypothetical protein
LLNQIGEYLTHDNQNLGTWAHGLALQPNNAQQTLLLPDGNVVWGPKQPAGPIKHQVQRSVMGDRGEKFKQEVEADVREDIQFDGRKNAWLVEVNKIPTKCLRLLESPPGYDGYWAVMQKQLKRSLPNLIR